MPVVMPEDTVAHLHVVISTIKGIMLQIKHESSFNMSMCASTWKEAEWTPIVFIFMHIIYLFCILRIICVKVITLHKSVL
jgi:hypothetical protein